MITPQLKLEVRWYPVEDDGTEGRLTATAASNVFWGRGHGEIERKWLDTFADALSAYPISADRLPEFAAGRWRDGKLIEAGFDFVRITIRPLTAKGLLLARIGLGEASSVSPDGKDYIGIASHGDSKVGTLPNDQPPLYRAYYKGVGAAFPVHYQAISDFASALRGLASGTAEEATLQGAVA
jgi:hypothetical protein